MRLDEHVYAKQKSDESEMRPKRRNGIQRLKLVESQGGRGETMNPEERRVFGTPPVGRKYLLCGGK